MTFVCSKCDRPAGEVNMRHCAPCGRSYIAGYTCTYEDCGHEDIDAPGQEWGHEPHADGVA